MIGWVKQRDRQSFEIFADCWYFHPSSVGLDKQNDEQIKHNNNTETPKSH